MDQKQVVLDYFQNDWPKFYGRYVTIPDDHNGHATIRSPIRDDDKNPSFKIDFEGERAGRWHDFGLNEGGSAFDFIMRTGRATSFPEAIKFIAQEFGIPIQNGARAKSETTKVKTLADRGISPTITEAFQIIESPGNGKVTHCIDFPIFDLDGKKIGTKTHKAGQTKGNTAQLYPWKALRHDTIYIVNGEPSVWRAWESGYRDVLCGTGGEGAFKSEWIEHFKGKTVRLVLDNDEAGRKGMVKIAGMLHDVAASVEVIQWPEGFSEKGDVEDWLNGGHRMEDFEFAVYSPEESENETWPEPQPIPDIIPPVESFVLGLLPTVFQPWIRDIAERIQCPPDFPAIGVMVALAAVVGRQVAMRPKVSDDWQVVPNLWGGIIGSPGQLKTATLQEALRPLDRLEARAREEYEAAQRDFEAQKLVQEARQKHAKAEINKAFKTDQDPYQIAIAATVDDDEQPTRRRYRTNDPTIEKLGELLNENPRGLLLFRDELTGFLRTLDRDGHESDRAFYLEAWNGTGQFVFDRIGRGTIDIKAACISVLGGIQPGPLSAYMARAARGGQDDDGLVQRFQLVVWPDRPATWQNVDRKPDIASRQRAFDVFERLDCIDPETIGAEVPDVEGDLPFLRFSPEAQEIFTTWRTDLEHRLRGDDLPPMIEAHLAKYRSLIPSLALLIHLADAGTGPVSEDSLLRACAWGEYLESHAWRVYAPALSPQVVAGGALVDRIQKGDLDKDFAARDVHRKGWSKLTERETIGEALDLLEDLGWIRKVEVPTEGRPRIRYLVNPQIYSEQTHE